MFKYLAPLLCLLALAIPGAALADDPPDTVDAAPSPLSTPVLPGGVTDEAGAGAFARAFLIARAGDLVPGARALNIDVAGCREVDATNRFYCLARARLAQIQRVIITRHVRSARKASDDPPKNRHPVRRPVRVIRFRVRLFECVAVVRILGGPGVTPSATLPVRDCVRIPRPA